MKEDIRLIEIQLPEDSEIIEALIASRNKEENIDNIEILLYLGKRKKPLKIILRPRSESLDFDVTTPLYHFHPEMKEEAHIGKAQISKALPIGAPIKSNLTDLYSLSIEMVEKPTDSTESFIKRIKVLKDELAVAKETLRLTGDIFHILPNAKKRLNIVKNKTKLEHFDFSELDPLVQKENNPLSLYLDIPVSKSILLPEILKDLKKWKNILSLETIDISLDNDLKIGHVSKFVYRAHSPRGNDCTYELMAKCIINNVTTKEIISKFSINPNLLGPTIKAAAIKSLENAYLNYNKKKRKEEAIQTLKEAPSNSKSEEKNSECACCKNNELSELFERMREFLNKLPITQIESLSQIDIDTKNENKPSGYTSRIKTIYPDLNPSPVNKTENEECKCFSCLVEKTKELSNNLDNMCNEINRPHSNPKEAYGLLDQLMSEDKFSELENKSEAKEEDHYKKESLAYDLLKNLMSKNQNLSRKSKTIHGDGSRANYKEQKVFVSSHALESDAVRAVEEWTRKLNKNTNNGDLFTTRGIKLINFGFIHGFKTEAEESANGAYATHRIKTYSIYANIKINTTNIKENKLTVTEEDIRAAVICSLERLSLKKDEIKEIDKERLFFQAIRPGLSPLELRDMIKDDVSASKATETIIVPFSIVLKDVIAYNHLLEYTKYYKATFRIKDKEFKGEIKSINIQDFYATTVNTRRASPSSIKAIVNIAITQECKDTIDNLVKEMGIGFEEVCVGSLAHHLLNKSAGALYTIKSYAEKEDRQTINIDMSLNPVEELERFTQLVNEYSNFPFTVSTGNEQAARIIYCANTEEEAVNLIMNIKEKLKNRFIENKSKQSSFSIYDNYINIETKTFSSNSIILKVQDIVLVASKDLGRYFVVAKLQ